MNYISKNDPNEVWKEKAYAFNEAIKQHPLNGLDGVWALRSALSTVNRKIIKGEITVNRADAYADLAIYENFFIENLSYGVFTVKQNEFIFKYKHSDFIDYLGHEGKGNKFDGDDIGFDDVWIFNNQEDDYEYSFDDGKRYLVRSFGMVKTDVLVGETPTEEVHFYAVVGIHKNQLLGVIHNADQFLFAPELLKLADYIDGDKKEFCKAVVTGTYDTSNNTFSKRVVTVLFDGGNQKVSLLEEREWDLDLDFDDKIKGEKIIQTHIETWEKYHDLYSVLYEFLKLPTYSNFKHTVGFKRKYRKKPKNTQPHSFHSRQVFSKVGKFKQFVEVNVQSLRYQTPNNRSRKSSVRIPTLRWSMIIRGYWRRLSNSTSIGKDQRGEYCQMGRTWVVSHIRNKDLPRKDVVFHKCSVSDARNKIHKI